MSSLPAYLGFPLTLSSLTFDKVNSVSATGVKPLIVPRALPYLPLDSTMSILISLALKSFLVQTFFVGSQTDNSVPSSIENPEGSAWDLLSIDPLPYTGMK